MKIGVSGWRAAAMSVCFAETVSGDELMFAGAADHVWLWLSLTLGLVAGLADYLGGFLLVRRSPSAKALRYFVALGAGFMLAAAVLEMVPEGMQVNPRWAPLLILAGYCGVHLLEHTLVPHFHFGEETHHR